MRPREYRAHGTLLYLFTLAKLTLCSVTLQLNTENYPNKSVKLILKVFLVFASSYRK